MTRSTSLPSSHQQIPLSTRLFDLALVAALVVYAVSAIVTCWQSPYLLALLLLPAPLALVARLGRSFLTVTAAGAVIGPLTEVACVFGGLWRYADTGGLPFIPPGFSSSGPAFSLPYG